MSGRTTPSGTRPPSGLGLFSHSAGTPSSSTAAHTGSPAPAHPLPSSSGSTTSTSVQVALRIRPPPAPDATSSIPPRFQRSVVHPSSGSSTQLTVEAAPPNSKGPARQNFSFDRVIGPDDGQASVYEQVEPLVARFMEGYNVTVLAYGQTSSGKSYTMGTDMSFSAFSSPSSSNNNELRNDERAGIIPRAVDQVFDHVARRTRSESGRWKCEIKTSYVEIYNEELIDLLAGDVGPDERTPVTIREDKAGHIIWSGLKEIKVKKSSDVMRNLEAGSSIRQTGSTAMNDQSSRSHAIFSLTLTQRKYTGQGTPPQPRSNESSPSLPQSSTFGTPSRASHQHRYSTGIPGRVGSPTPSLPGGIGSPMRPSTPGSSRLIPRPSSSLGRGGAGDPRAPSPNSMTREDDEKGNLQRMNDNEWTIVVSKFHFVDLAGSERLKRTSAIGERAKEGISINSGLLALGNVISALGDPAKARQTTHIPYRDSKLTRLLQDSLGGNAHTLMIACVSPVEYNISETLNTLKYANRARNIKNRAELNEVEAGWEDVEHLQNLVTRLRSELTVLRSGNGSMPSITEEDAFRASNSGSAPASLLSLQDQYSDLSTRYAKLTAELAKAHATISTSTTSSPSSMSIENFAQAVEPVVEEYEKSISALESQLSLTKAALSHSEEVMRESEEKMNFESQINQNNVKVVNELKTRLAKIMEREAVTEAYVRDLEGRLKSSTEQDEASAALIADLKKELAKYREVESNTEKYIKELEARLSKSEEAQQLQKGQIESLERDIHRREQAYQELEGRLSLLDTTEQHKQLLFELDERDKRILEIQRELESAQLQMTALEADTRRLKEGADQDAKQKDSLHRRIESLEKQPRIAVLASSDPKSAGGSSAHSLAIGNSLTPPQTPLHEGDANTSTEHQDNLVFKLADLERRHEMSLKDLNNLSIKYKESLKQIEELSQMQGMRFRKKSSTSTSTGTEETGSSPETLLETLDDVPEETPQDSTTRRSSLSPINASYNTPTRASRGGSGTSRRSMPLSPRGSFLGRSPVATHSASHLRSASASLSQELWLAQYLNGTLPSSNISSGNTLQLHQNPTFSATAGYGGGSLPSPHMMLQNGTSSPRPTSPLLSRRESLLHGSEVFFPQVPERSNESLQQEVKKLQETLNEREEEIRALEAGMAEIKSRHAAETQTERLAKDITINPPNIVADDSLKMPVGRTPPGTLSLSPNTVEAFNAIKKSMDQAGETVNDASDAQLARLDDLMLSMAKKEVAHQEKVEELEEQLSTLRKQHEELRTLSKDQVLSMSTEITALREQLSSSSAETKEWEAKLAKMDSDIKQKGEQVDNMLDEQESSHQSAIEALKEEHARALLAKEEAHKNALRQLEEKHATLLRRMLDAKDELFMRKAEEHDAALQRLVREHEEADKQKDLSHQEDLKAVRDELVDGLRRKETDHKEALERLQLQLASTRDSDQAELVKNLNAQHEAALTTRDEEHHAILLRLKADHEEALSSRQQEHKATLANIQEEHEATLTRILEDHSEALQEVREERDAAIKKLTAEHEQQIAKLVEQHQAQVDGLVQDLEKRLDALQAEHDRETAALKEAHEMAMFNSDIKAKQAEDALRKGIEVQHSNRYLELEDAIKAIQTKHADELAAEKDLSETALVALQEQHQLSVAALKETHAAVVSQLIEEHKIDREASDEKALDHLRQEHEAATDNLQRQHERAREDLIRTHDNALASLSAEVDQKLAAKTAEHEDTIKALTAEHEQLLRKVQTDADENIVASRAISAELEESKKTLEALRAQSAEQQRLVEDLKVKAGDCSKLQCEIELLQRSAEQAQKTEATLNTELQESLDALGTLEKALNESQDERERLMGELSELQKKAKAVTGFESLAAQLASANEEKETLKAEVNRLTAILSARRPLSPSAQGLGINGFGARSSKDQETLLNIHASEPSGDAQSPYNTVRHNSVVSLVNGSHLSSRPPPTPPPSMPPPPLPTEAYNQFNTSVNGPSSSSVSLSNKGRDSVSSVFTRDSHMDTMTSNRTMSLADTISVDPRVHQKFEEQEAALGRLTKRLEHAETELKANIDLVTTLESALNDSERNLRKARIQMNEIAKEREKYQTQNESLRQQVVEGQREVDNARHALMIHEEESRKKLEAQKRAQREAQTNAEQRMAEIQRLNRKSKFNCF